MSAEALKVLVPVDFSETSRRALAWAYDYAQRAPCELHLLHVVEDRAAARTLADRERIRMEVAEIVEEAYSELERMAPDSESREKIGRIIQHVTRGNPAKEILAYAEKLGAETIVMGTHGAAGLEGLLIGSVAQKVVRLANCPVVCVKPFYQARSGLAHAPIV